MRHYQRVIHVSWLLHAHVLRHFLPCAADTNYITLPLDSLLAPSKSHPSASNTSRSNICKVILRILETISNWITTKHGIVLFPSWTQHLVRAKMPFFIDLQFTSGPGGTIIPPFAERKWFWSIYELLARKATVILQNCFVHSHYF